MTYLGFQQVPGGVAATAIALSSALTIPAGAAFAELQPSLNHIRYTIDTVVGNVPTTTYGHLLRTTDPPRTFTITDLKNMRVIRDGATTADLFVHYRSD